MTIRTGQTARCDLCHRPITTAIHLVDGFDTGEIAHRACLLESPLRVEHADLWKGAFKRRFRTRRLVGEFDHGVVVYEVDDVLYVGVPRLFYVFKLDRVCVWRLEEWLRTGGDGCSGVRSSIAVMGSRLTLHVGPVDGAPGSTLRVMRRPLRAGSADALNAVPEDVLIDTRLSVLDCAALRGAVSSLAHVLRSLSSAGH